MAGGGERDVDGGHADGHPERRPGVLEGVETAQQQILPGERDQAEAEGLEHVARGGDGRGVHGAVAVEELGDLRAEGQEEERGRDDQDAGDAQRAGEFVAQIVRAVVGGRAAHPRQQGRDQRDGDEGLRQVPDVLGHGIGRVSDTGIGKLQVRGAGEAGDDGHRGEVGEHQQQGPAGGDDALAQAVAAPVEPRPEAESGGPDEGDQGQALEGDSAGGGQAQEVDLAGRDLLDAVGAGQQAHVEAEHRDQHEVVEDGRPHHRAELAPGVEDLAENEEQAVEEDLREEEAGEDDGELEGGVGRGGVGDEERDDSGRGPHRERRPDRQHAQHEGDQPLLEGPAAVGVLGPGPYELGHQDGVQGAADQQGVDAHRDGVGDAVRAREQTGAQRAGLECRADQPGHPRDHRPRGHQQ